MKIRIIFPIMYSICILLQHMGLYFGLYLFFILPILFLTQIRYQNVVCYEAAEQDCRIRRATAAKLLNLSHTLVVMELLSVSKHSHDFDRTAMLREENCVLRTA